jgi:hypothetical protein
MTSPESKMIIRQTAKKNCQPHAAELDHQNKIGIEEKN